MPTTPEWAVTWPDLAGGLGAIIILTAGVWLVIKFVHPLLVRLGLVMDLILGRPAQQGIPGQPSMVERIDSVKTDVTAIRAELSTTKRRVEDVAEQVQPNHGSSAHDKLSREITAARSEASQARSEVAALADDVKQVITALDRVYGIQVELPDIDSGTPGV